MNFKSLFITTSIALTLIACDDSTSASAGDDVVAPGSSETITTSSESTTPSSESTIPSSESTTPPSGDISITSSETITPSSESIAPTSSANVLPTSSASIGSSSSASINTDFVCTGELNDNEWVAILNGNIANMVTYAKSVITFDGTTMTTDNWATADLGSEDFCQLYMTGLQSEFEEDDENDSIYGPAVGGAEYSCEGSVLSLRETRVKTNITAADREAAYNDTMVECQDYRDGKRNFAEEVMD